MLEALVEALLRSRPDDVESFSAEWLLHWHKDHHEEQQEDLEPLRAERDHYRTQRDQLLQELQALGEGAQ
ncbi:unnamed protein product [Durusdinium trenchii]|uniref:Uncharacterized protein n=1 Tax=Durusdinium trenchii TaxID=1381693 RepID=A0ABP0QMY2_9DINO